MSDVEPLEYTWEESSVGSITIHTEFRGWVVDNSAFTFRVNEVDFPWDVENDVRRIVASWNALADAPLSSGWLVVWVDSAGD